MLCTLSSKMPVAEALARLSARRPVVPITSATTAATPIATMILMFTLRSAQNRLIPEVSAPEPPG